MKRYKIYYILLFVVSLLFLHSNIINMLERVNNMVEINEIRGFWNLPYSNIDEEFQLIVDEVVLFFQDLPNNIYNIFEYILTVLISEDALIIYCYIAQFMIIIHLMFTLWVMGDSKSFKTSFLANIVIYIMESIIWFLKDFYRFVKTHLRSSILIVLISSGMILTYGMEILIFLLLYLLSLIQFLSHEVIFSIFKWITVKLTYYILIYPNILEKIIVFTTIFVLVAIYNGHKKLRKNWNEFKTEFVGQAEPLNVVFGPPGNGKTSTSIQAVYAQTELFYDKWTDALIQWELMHSSFNFSKIRLMMSLYFCEFKKDYIDKVFNIMPNVIVEFAKINDVIDEQVLDVFRKMYYRGCPVISATPLIDPYRNNYVRALNFNSLRLFKENDMLPFEDDTSIFIDEFDKELNSHSSQKEVSEDGTHGFFSYIRHLTGSSSTSWMTCQGLGQGLRSIKDCAGRFFYLNKKKVKMPLGISIIYSFVMFFYVRLLNVIKDYLGMRLRTGKFTYREGRFLYKRNNVSFLYQVFKYLGLGMSIIVSYLENFYYYKISGEVWCDTDGNIKSKIKYKINFCDYYHNGNVVYNSEQFRSFYDDFKEQIERKKKIKQSLELFDYWTSLDPTMEFYASTNQRFIKKIYDAQVNGDEYERK